ncbi:MAG: phosphoribosylformylglycinamidine synthase subunit PurS [Cytophagales bacterium]|nr:phosphoribosylformylglycinamidine synthase subunit PurS [Cytophagales bacterium]
MRFKAEIDIMPLKEILDPQGKAVKLGLGNLGINNIENVRIGKHITLELNAKDEEQAKQVVDQACKKLLANLVIEDYKYNISLKSEL